MLGEAMKRKFVGALLARDKEIVVCDCMTFLSMGKEEKSSVPRED